MIRALAGAVTPVAPSDDVTMAALECEACFLGGFSALMRTVTTYMTSLARILGISKKKHEICVNSFQNILKSKFYLGVRTPFERTAEEPDSEANISFVQNLRKRWLPRKLIPTCTGLLTPPFARKRA